jgi:hypothetical protein
MESWLSKMSCVNIGNSGHDNYLPWVCSIISKFREYISFVSHADWEHAKRIVESSLAQDRQMVEEEILGRPHSAIDVQALIGALYLCNLARNASGFHVEKVNDIYNFTEIKDRFSGYYWRSMRLPKVTPTPVMIEIRSTLQAAHPTCCEKLGPKMLDWYSASIALLGIPNSVDWECKRCVPCKAVIAFRKLTTHKPELPDTAKQQVFDATIRKLVSAFHFLKMPLFLQYTRQCLLLMKD